MLTRYEITDSDEIWRDYDFFDITIFSLIDKKKDFEFSYRNLLTIFLYKWSKKMNKLSKHAIY